MVFVLILRPTELTNKQSGRVCREKLIRAIAVYQFFASRWQTELYEAVFVFWIDSGHNRTANDDDDDDDDNEHR